MLKIDDVEVFYDEVQALKGVSLEVNKGEIVTLIGANGAGKTTTLKTISGLIKPAAGRIHFEGKAYYWFAAEHDRRPRYRPRARGSTDFSATHG